MILHDASALEFEAESAELPTAQAYVPGGMLFGWLLENELCNFEAVPAAWTVQFLRREKTGPQLLRELSGQLETRHLGEHGVAFARWYLPSTYLSDFAEQFPVPSPVHVLDTWHNYEWIRITIVARYSQWRAAQPD